MASRNSNETYYFSNDVQRQVKAQVGKIAPTKNKTAEIIIIRGLRYDSDMAVKDAEIIRLRTELAKVLWNAEADHMNQWDNLSGDEKSELIARLKSTN